MSTEQFSPEESLKLIRNMIDKTREDISGNSKYFLLWGWGAFAGCVGQFILKVVYDYPHHYRVWFITILCAIASIILSIKDNRKERVRTYVSENMVYVWSGLGIAFIVISLIFIKIGWQYCFPFFMLLYGLGTFISGRVLKYNAFIIGGLISFILAAVSVWIPYDYQILCAAVALLCSYIIPGHLLRCKYKKGG
jgi:hypothetical protein